MDGGLRADDKDVVLRLYCVGDFGRPNPDLAAAMNAHAATHGFPDCILGLGDNFYEAGVRSVDDPLFDTVWRDVYLEHASLRCPWHLVLGNHDYRGNPEAQIAYSSSERNSDRIWNMPAKNYSFSCGQVDLFALDTNGAQSSVQMDYPTAACDLHQNIDDLDRKLQAADSSNLKIVFAHHPMYTRGKYHSMIGRSLRTTYGLEEVLARNKVDLYITGHEHVFQYHTERGVHSFVCGASCEYKFYGGEDKTQPITWADYSRSLGFLSLEIRRDLSVSVRFLATSSKKGKEPKSIFEKIIFRADSA